MRRSRSSRAAPFKNILLGPLFTNEFVILELQGTMAEYIEIGASRSDRGGVEMMGWL